MRRFAFPKATSKLFALTNKTIQEKTLIIQWSLFALRALDSELRAHIKGGDPQFDVTKLAFFQEATGIAQETHIAEAQSAVANAQKSSLVAAFGLFQTSLGNDQCLHDRYLAASKTDETRARNAVLESLEDKP